MLFSCAILILSANRHAQATSFFSGQVTDSKNNPVVGAIVQAGHLTFDPSGYTGWEFISDGQATTGPDGVYSITTLDALNSSGQYVLAAQKSGYFITAYPNFHCVYSGCLGDPSLPTYAPQSSVNFSLLRPASISGTVTRADSNALLYSQSIQLTGADVFTSSQTQTDSAGKYLFDGLLPGSYQVTVGAPLFPLLPQIYAQHDVDVTMLTNGSGDLVALQEGEAVNGVDFSLHLGASISGKIMSTANSAAIFVMPLVLRQGASGKYEYPQVPIHDDQGNYVIGPFMPGALIVQFQSNGQYLPLFYNQAATQAQAQPVTLLAGQNSAGINAQLTPERSIAGIVIDAVTQQPMAGAIVHAGRLGLFFLGDSADATTDASGHYFLQGLDSNSYYLWTDGAPGYQPQFYANAIPCCDDPALAGATAHVLGSAEHATGMNFSLQKGAYGSGRIYDPATNAGLAGAYVQLYDSTGKPVGPINGFGYPVSLASTAAGNFNTAAVPNGNYYLAMTYASKTILYPNVPCTVSAGCNFAQSQLLHFSAAQQYPHLDFVIAHLDQILHDGFEK